MTQEQQQAISTLRTSDSNKEYVAMMLEQNQAQLVYIQLPDMVDCEYLANAINKALGKEKFTAESIITEQQEKYFVFDGGVIVLL